jgi:multiple sugar transport system substrate-binding protein
VQVGVTPWFQDWAWPAMVEACGAKFYDGASNKYNIADERIAGMLEYWLTWIDQEYKGDFGKLKEQHSNWDAHGPGTSFGEGFQALCVGGIWSLTSLVDVPKINYEVYKMPIGPGGKESKASSWPNFFFIPKGAKHVQEAFELMAYYSTDGMVAWFDRWCDLPCWKKFPEDHAPLKVVTALGRERTLELVKFAREYVSAVVEQWNSPVDDFAIDQIGRAFDQVLRKVAKPADALAEAQKQCAAKLDEVMASS